MAWDPNFWLERSRLEENLFIIYSYFLASTKEVTVGS